MKVVILLTSAMAGLLALGGVAVVLGGLCCPPAGFVAHLAPMAAVAGSLDPSGFARRIDQDR